MGTTEGLGAGAQPEVGRAGAEESLAEIMEQLAGAHMVFIAAGMGGGTGTGAAPVIARAVREAGILTVGVVTKPFALEGDRRMRVAEKGITELQQFVHTLIVIPNQNLFRVASDRTTMSQAFAMADEVLHAGVRGVTDLIVMPGLINLDFADIKSVITEMGKAMMGTGEAEGEDRAIRAADMAISNPLLDDVTMKGAKGVLINITGGPDLMLFEVEQAANRIRAEVDPDANIIFGNTILEEMEGRIRVSVVATGIDAEQLKMPEKVHTLRPHLKPQAFRIEPVKPMPAAMVNPVQAQVDSLAAELNAAPVTNHGATMDQPWRGRSPYAWEEGLTDQLEELGGACRGGHIPPPKTIGRLGSSLWRTRRAGKEDRLEPVRPQKAASADIRAEPLPLNRPRATAHPCSGRGRRSGRSANRAEDLFPDHGTEEQFEIPAFFSRQSN